MFYCTPTRRVFASKGLVKTPAKEKDPKNKKKLFHQKNCPYCTQQKREVIRDKNGNISYFIEYDDFGRTRYSYPSDDYENEKMIYGAGNTYEYDDYDFTLGAIKNIQDCKYPVCRGKLALAKDFGNQS